MSRGALHGAKVWATYAIVELAFAFIFPWLVQPAQTYVPIVWQFAAVSLLLYPVVGMLIGSLLGAAFDAVARRGGILRRAEPALFLSAVATMSVVVALMANLVLQGPVGASELPPLAIGLLLLLALCLSAVSDVRFAQLHFLTHPAVAVALLLGVPWMTGKLLMGYQSIGVKALLLALYVAVVLLISLGMRRTGKHLFARWSASPGGMSLVSLALLAAMVIGICAILKRASAPAMLQIPPARVARDRPNVILISLDTVRADHLSPYGYRDAATPNLREFSERATLYQHALSSSDITLSSHASMFTCVYASQHDARYAPPAHPWGRPLDDRLPTLAGVLSEKGFLTLGVVANHAFLGREFGMARGFQYYDQRVPSFLLRPDDPFYLKEALRDLSTRFVAAWRFARHARSGAEINREVFSLLARTSANGPFFLFVNYMDAHWPYLAPPPFDPAGPVPLEVRTDSGLSDLKRRLMKAGQPLSPDLRRNLVSLYDRGIAYLDFNFGQLMAELQRLGLYDDSLIMVTSDHGEAFGERGLIAHGVSVYQDQVHVPLFIKFPQQKEGAVVDDLVSGVDLMPTVLDVLGYDIPKYCEGESLRGPGSKGSRIVISETFPARSFIDFNRRFDRVGRAVFSGHLKLITATTGYRELYELAEQHELYDLSTDSSEGHDIAADDEDGATALRMRLQEWLGKVQANPPAQGRSQGAIDSASQERLRALGYEH